MSTELLPCPFCGHVGLNFDEGSTFRWLAYSCAGCGMGSETRVQTLGDGTPEQWLDIAKQHAVAEWNRRATRVAAIDTSAKRVDGSDQSVHDGAAAGDPGSDPRQ